MDKKRDGPIEMDASLGKIENRAKLIIELKAFMAEIRYDLSARKEHNIMDFVRLLVGEKYASTSLYKKNSGILFCEKYTISVFKEYSPNDEACNLFLAVNGLSPEYAKLSITKRVNTFAEQNGDVVPRTVRNHLDRYVSKICETLADEICTFRRKNLIALANEVFSQLSSSSESENIEILQTDDSIKTTNSLVSKKVTEKATITSNQKDDHDDNAIDGATSNLLMFENDDIKQERPSEDNESTTELEGDDKLSSVAENNTSVDSCTIEDAKSDEELSSDDYEIEPTKKPIGGVTDEADIQNGDSTIDNTQNNAVASDSEDSHEDDSAETPHHVSKDDNIAAKQLLKGSENSESATKPTTDSESSTSDKEASSTAKNSISGASRVPTEAETEKEPTSPDDPENTTGDKSIDEPSNKRTRNKKRLICTTVAIVTVPVVLILGIVWCSNHKPTQESINNTSVPEGIAEEPVDTNEIFNTEYITEEPEYVGGADDSEDAVNEHIMANWGDDEGGRPSYTASEVEYGILGDQVVFNSIDGEYSSGDRKSVYPGDERDFVRVCRPDTDPDDDSSWEGDHIAVEDTESYMVKIYASNNNRNGYDTVAKDTKVALSIPSYSDTQILIRGYIESSNAMPSRYWDEVAFVSTEDRPFHLKFRPGSALFHNNSIGKKGLKLNDDIVSKATEGGALIGYNDLDGNIPGGSQYNSEVTAWIDVIYDHYTVDAKVRKVGTKEWSEVVDAEIGEQVEFQIEYNNISTETQDNVMLCDVLPGNLKYVPNTTKLYNSNHPNWAKVTPDDDIVTRGVNIGSYLGSDDGQNGGNAYIRFTAEVVDTNLACGENRIYNWGRASVDDSVIECSSVVIVQKPEQ